jgi:hypothetical protein
MTYSLGQVYWLHEYTHWKLLFEFLNIISQHRSVLIVIVLTASRDSDASFQALRNKRRFRWVRKLNLLTECNVTFQGSAIAQAVNRWLPTTAARVRSRVWSSGICGGQIGSGVGFPEYFSFPCQSSFHLILHHHNHPGQATIGQSVATVPSEPSWTPHLNKRKKSDICI